MTRWICIVTICALVLAMAAQAGAEEDGSAALTRLADWVPPGADTYGNSYARGIEIVLNYLGHDVDYDTIMGDSGQAFIVQGEVNSVNTVDGAINIGWWPLDPMGINIRLGFLEKTVGRELREVVPTYDANGGAAYYDDPVRFYQRWFEPMVTSSLADGRPCIVQVSLWFVVTAVDDGDPPFIGNWAWKNETQITRMKLEDGYPQKMLAPGEFVPKIDRTAADAEALRYAVALHRDEVLGDRAGDRGEHPLRHPCYGTNWRTGVMAYSAWIEALRDTARSGQARWHNNAVFQLRLNRVSAMRYLSAMRERHSQAVARHLDIAVQRYEAVVVALEGADTGADALAYAGGRGELVAAIERIVDLESEAAAALEVAAAAMK